MSLATNWIEISVPQEYLFHYPTITRSFEQNGSIFKHLFSSSPAKPVLTFVYTCYYSSARYILSKETHKISPRNDTFKAQFQKLISISVANSHVTKYCCMWSGDVGQDWSFTKIQANNHSGLLDCAQHSRVPQNRPRCAECQTWAADINRHQCMTHLMPFRKHVCNQIVMSWEKTCLFAMDSFCNG